MAGLILERAPLVEPITLSAMKNFLRVDFANDDVLIQGLITAARELVEIHTSRTMVNTGYIQTLDSFPYYVDTTQSQRAYPVNQSYPAYSSVFWNYSQMIRLIRGPVVSVEKIVYLAALDQQYHALTPGNLPWQPSTFYNAGAKITVVIMNQPGPNNGFVMEAQADGFTDPNDPPAWNATPGSQTFETTGLPWFNLGIDPKNILQNTGVAVAFLLDNFKEPAQLFPGPPGAYWPTVMYAPSAVQIHFTSGQGDAIPVGSPITSYLPPTTIRTTQITAIQQLVAGWYEHRESLTPLSLKTLPLHVEALLASAKIPNYSATRG